MGNAEHKGHFQNRFSNVSVLEASLDTKNSVQKGNSPNSDFDFIEDLKDTIDLHIENEVYESNEIVFDDQSDEIKNYIFSEGEAPPVQNPYLNLFRSKSHAINQNLNLSLFNAPKPKVKEFNEFISPFKLSNKCLGGSQWKIKKPNEVLLDFQKNIIDNKSCNDNINSEDYIYDDEIDSNIDTERDTINTDDLKNLQNCRKKMALFRDSIDNKSELSLDENDKIEYIFSENKNQKKQNKSNKFWTKHIRQQIMESKISEKMRLSTNILKKSETLKPQKIEESGLFILGVLESANKEKKMKKKMRYTSNV